MGAEVVSFELSGLGHDPVHVRVIGASFAAHFVIDAGLGEGGIDGRDPGLGQASGFSDGFFFPIGEFGFFHNF